MRLAAHWVEHFVTRDGRGAGPRRKGLRGVGYEGSQGLVIVA